MRRRDPELLKILHLSPDKECCLTGEVDRLELHHVYPRGQGGDDVRENLVWLTAAKHALITANDRETCTELGRHLMASRWDVVDYIHRKLGPHAGPDWLARRLHVASG